MTRTPTIRPATIADAPSLLEIYRPYVESTTVSFELETPSRSEFVSRIEKAQSKWSWLVAERDDEIVGYAYGTEHRARAAYARSVETSAYVASSHHRQGIARALYLELLDVLRGKGYANAYAGITLPNPASVGLHQSLGFEAIGTFPRVGYKFGEWRDVFWLHRPIDSD